MKCQIFIEEGMIIAYASFVHIGTNRRTGCLIIIKTLFSTTIIPS